MVFFCCLVIFLIYRINCIVESLGDKMNIKIGLAGNPNCGKTTLFNLLTGSNQYVGNWSGVTVESKEGILKIIIT